MTKFTSQFYTGNNKETYVGYLTEDGNERFLAAVTVNGEKAALWLFNTSEGFISPKQIITSSDAHKHIYGFGIFGDRASCLDQPVVLQEALQLVDFNSRKIVVSGDEVIGIKMAWENMELNLERVPCSLSSVLTYNCEKENDEEFTSLPADVRSRLRAIKRDIDLDIRQLHDYMEVLAGRTIALRLLRNKLENNLSMSDDIHELIKRYREQGIMDNIPETSNIEQIVHKAFIDLTISHNDITSAAPYHFDRKASEVKRVMFEICGCPCYHYTDKGAMILDPETLDILEAETDDEAPDLKMGKLLHTGVTISDYLSVDNAVRKSFTLFDGSSLNNKRYPIAAVAKVYYDLKKKQKALLGCKTI